MIARICERPEIDNINAPLANNSVKSLNGYVMKTAAGSLTTYAPKEIFVAEPLWRL